MYIYFRLFRLKILLFLENNSKKIKKPFSKIAKGLEIVSSPYWSRSELFVGVKF